MNPSEKFPVIRSVRYKDKTFFITLSVDRIERDEESLDTISDMVKKGLGYNLVFDISRVVALQKRVPLFEDKIVR